MVYGYIRVSTDSQTTDNQKILITDYAKKHSIKKIEWVSETISGTKNPEKRKSGRSLNSLCKEYKVNWTTMKKFLTKYVYMDKPDFIEPIKKHGHMSIADREFFKNDF